MTILQVASGTSIYGGERILLSLAGYLKDKGHRVIILSPGMGELVAACRNSGYEVAVIPLKKTYDIIAILRLYLLIKREKIDIVHSHGLLVNIIGRAAAFLSGCNIVNTIHVIQHLSDGPVPHLRRLRNIYYRALDNFTMRFCRKIIAVSKAVEKDLVKQGIDRNKLLTIPNGIELIGGFTPTPISEGIPSSQLVWGCIKKNNESLRKFGVKENDRAVGLVGRIVPLKGHDDFITAAKILSISHPEIKFLVIGDDIACGGGYLRHLKDRVRKEGLEGKVIFTGFVKDVREAMANLDVLVLPAWEEPFGLVILEAMSIGVPVVASNAGGVPEIIRDGENGLLIPPHSPEELSKAILKILSDRELAIRLSREGVLTAKKYTALRMAEAVENIYLTVCRR